MKQLSVFFVINSCIYADTVRFDGDVFPEVDSPAWERVGTLDAERWVDQGEFVQRVELGNWPGPEGEQDFYKLSLTGFAQDSTQPFVIEWECATDAPSSIIGNVPTVLSAASNTGGVYHFTITEDLVRFFRSTQIPLLFVPIDPQVSHRFRLELCPTAQCGEERYSWSIDGRVIEEGVAEGSYPTEDSFIIWGSSHYAPHDITARWDYIEFGDPTTVAIPTTSNWGLAVLCLLLATAGTLAYRKNPATHE